MSDLRPPFEHLHVQGIPFIIIVIHSPVLLIHPFSRYTVFPSVMSSFLSHFGLSMTVRASSGSRTCSCVRQQSVLA